MALRNLFAHKVKSFIVGALMAFGTFVFVFGTAMLDSVEGTMTESITSSIAGHLQIYDADAKDDLSLFGSGYMSADDVGHIPDFAQVKAALSDTPGVQAVVPMGLGFSMVSSPSDLDRRVAALRLAHAEGRGADIRALWGGIRTMAAQLKKDLELRTALDADQEELAKDQAIVARALSDELLADFAADPEATMEWLDTRLAPVGGDGWLYYMRYVGTDPAEFAARFERFELVEGRTIPEGKRGFLFNQNSYDKHVKHKVARELDRIHEEVTVRGRRIANDPTLAERVARNARQYRRIVEQLSPAAAAAVEGSLRALLPEAQGDLAALVQAYLVVDDANVASRRAHFYEHVARVREFSPMLFEEGEGGGRLADGDDDDD